MCIPCSTCIAIKHTNLKLKTRPKQILAFTFPIAWNLVLPSIGELHIPGIGTFIYQFSNYIWDLVLLSVRKILIFERYGLSGSYLKILYLLGDGACITYMWDL